VQSVSSPIRAREQHRQRVERVPCFQECFCLFPHSTHSQPRRYALNIHSQLRSVCAGPVKVILKTTRIRTRLKHLRARASPWEREQHMSCLWRLGIAHLCVWKTLEKTFHPNAENFKGIFLSIWVDFLSETLSNTRTFGDI